MVTKEEFGNFISEFESFRDIIIEELSKLKNEIENMREDFNDLRKELKK